VRDIHATSSSYMTNIRGARAAIPRLLDLFVEYDVAATWSTVGFLFAESRDELELFHPAVRPRYEDPRLDPYVEPVGVDEAADPLHFAPSLIRLIASTPRQEIGTHTYSHYYCLEAGAGIEDFRHDVASAVAIGRAKGFDIRSIVLPRNQWNPAHAAILIEAGIECYRGNQPGWMYEAMPFHEETRAQRLARLADAVVPITRWEGTAWDAIGAVSGLHDVPATCFLRPVGQWPRRVNDARLRRITAGITRAAAANRMFHLWWHPHNFGTETSENLAFLRRILEHVARMGAEYDMRSMSMLDASRHARQLLASRSRV
jgi:peptidoglycan/xylan/chitin deacetylase (PgdA/CDA1 family)